MKIEKRSDNRSFDSILPIHIDIDQINEENKTCKYISGNINGVIYNKNTNNKLIKIVGGDYNYEIKDNKKIILGNGSKSLVTTTLIGPTQNNLIFSKDIEYVQFNIRIKNMNGNRTEREKIFEEIITKNFEQIFDHSLYKFQQFYFKVQILHECSYILSSIINSIMINCIYNNISLNYVINSINIGIVDKQKYQNFIDDKYSSSDFILEDDDNNNKENKNEYQNIRDKLFYEYKSKYIPKIILDPLNEEIELYCNSAFCFIVAPKFHKVLSNILIKNHLGISRELFLLSESYAYQVSNFLHENIKKNYKLHLNKMETYLNNNYFY
ncbi:conserved Plasmodium protein, unknown function [Plasmodium gallinaceum]|uniref:Uncharacterized protein n=1 Tax=Plasmodium gallinaceum TaxID=5849 RepID=A0A1J1GZZ2_PLAGA|nr:conserved Plasmodium protein, unknown function [Plasmodium gallinaceum]CRG98190.1 conserved Plasmodium protein, unknown function [Plasmodium gallinaceum]